MEENARSTSKKLVSSRGFLMSFRSIGQRRLSFKFFYLFRFLFST